MNIFEPIADELMRAFNITAPPIPIENMLQHPSEDMWTDLDISQISLSFLRATDDYYAPRMSLTRLLVRQLAISAWGRERNLFPICEDTELLHAFARMVVMPGSMIAELAPSARTPTGLCLHFEVPEDEARLRLQEWDRAPGIHHSGSSS